MVESHIDTWLILMIRSAQVVKARMRVRQKNEKQNPIESCDSRKKSLV